MPLYVTVREGSSPATSVPVLVVADRRLIRALVDELVRLAEDSTDAHPPLPDVSPRPHGRKMTSCREGATA